MQRLRVQKSLYEGKDDVERVFQVEIKVRVMI